jgi:hypothetical protein
MNISKFIAKIYALIYLCTGLGFLLSTEYYKVIWTSFFDLSLTTYLVSISMLVTGLVIIRYHNIWEQSWKLWITLIGWVSLTKGVIFLIFPGFFLEFRHMIESEGYYSSGGIFSLVIGLILGYFGFFHKERKVTLEK